MVVDFADPIDIQCIGSSLCWVHFSHRAIRQFCNAHSYKKLHRKPSDGEPSPSLLVRRVWQY